MLQAVSDACGDLTDFVRLVWEGLKIVNLVLPEPPSKELVLFRGAELSKEVFESYRRNEGRYIVWTDFNSFTMHQSRAMELAREIHGGVGVVFELRSIGWPGSRPGGDMRKRRG
jgi:hypothetical protein